MAARTTAALLMITPMVGALSLFLFGMCADFNSNSESHAHGAAGGLGANFDFAAAKDMVSVKTGLPTDFGKASRGR